MTQTPTRRSMLKRSTVAGATVFAPGIVSVARAATDSGSAELTVDATVPEGTHATVTVYENDEDDETDSEVELSDGEETYELPTLDGSEDNNFVYYLVFYFETNEDNSETPEVVEAAFVLPEGVDGDDEDIAEGRDEEAPIDREEGDDLVDAVDNKIMQVGLLVGMFGGLATLARNASLPAVVGLTVFFYLSFGTEVDFLGSLVYLILAGIILSMAMAGISFILSGEGS